MRNTLALIFLVCFTATVSRASQASWEKIILEGGGTATFPNGPDTSNVSVDALQAMVDEAETALEAARDRWHELWLTGRDIVTKDRKRRFMPRDGNEFKSQNELRASFIASMQEAARPLRAATEMFQDTFSEAGAVADQLALLECLPEVVRAMSTYNDYRSFAAKVAIELSYSGEGCPPEHLGMADLCVGAGTVQVSIDMVLPLDQGLPRLSYPPASLPTQAYTVCPPAVGESDPKEDQCADVVGLVYLKPTDSSLEDMMDELEEVFSNTRAHIDELEREYSRAVNVQVYDVNGHRRRNANRFYVPLVDALKSYAEVKQAALDIGRGLVALKAETNFVHLCFVLSEPQPKSLTDDWVELRKRVAAFISEWQDGSIGIKGAETGVLFFAEGNIAFADDEGALYRGDAPEYGQVYPPSK